MALITFTGIDEKTPLTWLHDTVRNCALNSGYGAVEFAILRSPKAGQSPRYPTREVVERFHRALHSGHLAYHLCGGYARMVHEMRWAELADIVDFNQVGRVQVNSTECDEAAIVRLQRFAVHIGKPVIMQWRGNDFPLAIGIDLLQDRSGGNGALPTSWISPSPLCKKAKTGARIGYAGGLNPETLPIQLPNIISAAQGKNFWLDCESGVRTDDWFDTAKAQAMIDHLTGPNGRLAAAA